jgi:hypothetical protein
MVYRPTRAVNRPELVDPWPGAVYRGVRVVNRWQEAIRLQRGADGGGLGGGWARDEGWGRGGMGE